MSSPLKLRQASDMTLCGCLPFCVEQKQTNINSANIPHNFDQYNILNGAKRRHIIKEGYLYKTSKFLNISRKRWMVLHGVKLYSFKDRKDYYPTEKLDLTEYDTISDSDTSNHVPCFELKSSLTMKSRVFIAADRGEIYEWMKFIASVQAQNIQIHINIKQNHFAFADALKMYISYNESLLLSHIIHYIIQKVQYLCYPTKLWITKIDEESFTGRKYSDTTEIGYIDPNSLDIPITHWQYAKIHKSGLCLYLDNIYIDEVSSDNIECPYMMKKQTLNPLSCRIYRAMIRSKEYTKHNLDHLNEYKHFKNAFTEKESCIFYQNCASYKRMECGEYNICDICHLKLYKHPPRSKRAIINENNIKQLVTDRTILRTIFVYPLLSPKYTFNESNLSALIHEVVVNKYESDVSDCILDAINDKYECHRHIAMAQPLQKVNILALFLYTNCDCGYDLCQSQRNGNYKKWSVFDYFLFEAICKLNKVEIGKYSIYLGLNHNKLSQRQITNRNFKTYVSASSIKDVAISSVGYDGMMIQISQNTRNNIVCCDVSWISNFPDEYEVLIARSTNPNPQCFDCSVINDILSEGMQIIELENRFDSTDQIWQYFMNKQLTYLTTSNVIELEEHDHDPYSDLKVLHNRLMKQKRTKVLMSDCV